MRAVLQRVTQAHVQVDGQVVGQIQQGWLVLLGIGKGDTTEIARWLADRCVYLRAFADDQGKMNRSVLDVRGSLLVVSQFTLYGDCQRGRRPGFDAAASPELAKTLYLEFCDAARSLGVPVEQGIFQANMQVSLVNDGPVTFHLEREAVTVSKSDKSLG
ncbi:MAG: D-aminoacyl-tRNA deacylase [Pirellula sp.]|jgi:D-tyrosyl-tRNA(Tyr) deacylase|nr:D-aminoacyl-tRNA deacylase [Pirellula sp.]